MSVDRVAVQHWSCVVVYAMHHNAFAHVCYATTGTLEAALDARQALKAKVDSVAIHNTVILTQANCGYLPFAENWLFHVAQLNITNFLVISEDEAATAYLEQRYAGHTVSSALLDSTRAHLTLNEDKFQNFGSDSFIQLACARPVYLAAVLSLGFNVLWIDLDAALLIDPFKYIPWLYEYVGVRSCHHLAASQRSHPGIMCVSACSYSSVMYRLYRHCGMALLQGMGSNYGFAARVIEYAWEHVLQTIMGSAGDHHDAILALHTPSAMHACMHQRQCTYNRQMGSCEQHAP